MHPGTRRDERGSRSGLTRVRKQPKKQIIEGVDTAENKRDKKWVFWFIGEEEPPPGVGLDKTDLKCCSVCVQGHCVDSQCVCVFVCVWAIPAIREGVAAVTCGTLRFRQDIVCPHWLVTQMSQKLWTVFSICYPDHDSFGRKHQQRC